MADAIIATLCLFLIFAVSSQTAVSLLGRAVPWSWVDRHLVLPEHRNGLVRAGGLVFATGIAIACQATAIYALVRHPVDAPWPIYLLELFAAAIWVSIS